MTAFVNNYHDSVRKPANYAGLSLVVYLWIINMEELWMLLL